MAGPIDQEDGSSRDGPVRLDDVDEQTVDCNDVGEEAVAVGKAATNKEAGSIAAGNDTAAGTLAGNGKQGQDAAVGKNASPLPPTTGPMGAGGGLACGGEGGQNAAGDKDVAETGPCKGAEGGVSRGGQDVENPADGKETAADMGEDVMMSPTQHIREIRKLQKIELDWAKQDNRLPFASAQGQHGSSAISFELILSLLTDNDFPPDQRFTWVLERYSEIEGYHANSIILPFLQVCAKHAIISIDIFTAEWNIRSGPDTHPLTVNNVKVQEDRVPLHDGDIIVIGNVELKFACGFK